MKLAIEQIRIKRGWTVQYIADEIGITKSAVCQILKGRVNPSYNTLVKIEFLFDMRHDDLFKEVTADAATSNG